jgi:hypothetical protein
VSFVGASVSNRIESALKGTVRETSNKALNAINQINLVPFLMSFLAARAKLPIVTVTAAGALLGLLFM